MRTNWWKSFLSLIYGGPKLILIYTVSSEIFAPFLFLPFSPSLSAGKFKTRQLFFYQNKFLITVLIRKNTNFKLGKFKRRQNCLQVYRRAKKKRERKKQGENNLDCKQSSFFKVLPLCPWILQCKFHVFGIHVNSFSISS